MSLLPLSLWSCSDHKPFLSDRFDVHAYVHAILSGKTYRPDDGDEDGELERGRPTEEKERGDVSVELAKLNYGIVSCFLVQLEILCSIGDYRRT